MIFITGDIHGSHDIHKLSTSCFSSQKELTRSDYVIICGDFGLVWSEDSKHDKYWLKWLDEKPWTTLWIDGNHENFDLLSQYPTEDWKGGKIQKITDNIIHLCRGSVFDIDGTSIFAFGGAESHDKILRKEGKSWWAVEMPTAEEMEYGRKSLEAVNWKVNVVLSHSLPRHIQNELFKFMDYEDNKLLEYFDEIDNRLDFKFWFSGHYHKSRKYDDRHYLVYNDILRLTDNGVEYIYGNNT